MAAKKVPVIKAKKQILTRLQRDHKETEERLAHAKAQGKANNIPCPQCGSQRCFVTEDTTYVSVQCTNCWFHRVEPKELIQKESKGKPKPVRNDFAAVAEFVEKESKAREGKVAEKIAKMLPPVGTPAPVSKTPVDGMVICPGRKACAESGRRGPVNCAERQHGIPHAMTKHCCPEGRGCNPLIERTQNTPRYKCIATDGKAEPKMSVVREDALKKVKAEAANNAAPKVGVIQALQQQITAKRIQERDEAAAATKAVMENARAEAKEIAKKVLPSVAAQDAPALPMKIEGAPAPAPKGNAPFQASIQSLRPKARAAVNQAMARGFAYIASYKGEVPAEARAKKATLVIRTDEGNHLFAKGAVQ